MAEAQHPSMFRAAVEAAAAALPDAPLATAEQVVLAVLRVALPLHETQHADAWKAAHERAVHFELESVKAAGRAETAEKEVRRYRGVDAAAKELLARNVELGTRADNTEAKYEDLEDEVERLRGQLGRTRQEFGVRLFDDEPVDATEAMGNREQASELAAVWREEIENSNPTVMQRTVREEGKWCEVTL